ncbi:MAG: hypothetical protein CO186_10050 [Zetaproteobacteria bacterium CG_4_9_14_3_um_filter_49_83]|nr:MAG: hypothetical protein AUJ56_03030 [Zetaproteobacteria bacterium CG1_02_49_23]PIQ34517.1 MAG: hypothetical protein COW62_01575 [Zetaproteobacteria bacterium CG17_big_fil_post_rev_8_21_14_2_50_50_13]PIV30036.1 MAG: hypothetical protein COS35_08880 [Zetaproteobacteria bacterium CG02_land_8_20_14_3_00_50_9]PIY55340.1 MAG: hypothetical protein COZ00_09990 [Zetaproteobacteria bacterium CG_4_10_14_0_8_um_filter_49_80]PJA34495.1 MAG: hypothetical protein CO186_10050 [Zetaproteobacteria bacterium
MESRINYTIVGIFVVLLLTGIIMFAFWLGKYGEEQQYDRYYVYITESVAGLSTDTSVKFNGVNVGSVEQININMNNPEEVELLLKVKHGTPVKTDTIAKLKSFGITGLSFIELTGSTKDAPLLHASDSTIPIIQTGPSTFTQFDKSLRELIAKSVGSLEKFDQLLSDENLQTVSSLLSDTNLVVKDVRAQMQEFRKVLDNGVIMEQRMTQAFTSVEQASDSVKKMAERFEKNYANVGQDMRQDVRQSLVSFNRLINELDTLAGDMQRVVRATEASPSDLLFKQTSPRPGPGEEGYHE